MQELEDDYEQRLADRVRQLEEKADESRRAAREHAEEIRQVYYKLWSIIQILKSWENTVHLYIEGKFSDFGEKIFFFIGSNFILSVVKSVVFNIFEHRQ